MAYEYKEEIENHIICAPVYVDDEVFDELKEVYAKAKAFDEISDVIKNYEFYDRDTALDIIEIVEDLEDK